MSKLAPACPDSLPTSPHVNTLGEMRRNDPIYGLYTTPGNSLNCRIPLPCNRNRFLQAEKSLSSDRAVARTLVIWGKGRLTMTSIRGILIN